MNVVYELIGVDKASDAIKKVEGSFGKLESSWKAVTGALALGGTVAYLTNLVKQSLDAADSLFKLEQSTGITVETLSSLKLAAELSGVDVSALAGGINKMQKAMIDARDGNVELAATFKAIGVDINGGTKEALFQIADVFEQMPAGAEKTALAIQIFGKSGAALIPFLNQGAEGLREMEELSEKLGLTITAKAAAGAERFNDTMSILGMQAKGFGMQLMTALMPTLEGISKAMMDNVGAGGFMTVAVDVLTGAFKGLLSVGVVVYGSLKQLGSLLAGVAAAAHLAVTGDFSGAVSALKAGYADAEKAGDGMRTTLVQLWNNDLPKVEDKTRKAALALGSQANAAKAADEAMKRAAKAAEEFATATGKLIDSTQDFIEKQRLELQGGEKLSESQKKLLEIGKYLRDNYHVLADAEIRYWQEQMRVIDENERARVSSERLAKALDDYAKASQKAVDAQQKEVDKLQEKAAAIDLELQKVGLSKAAQEALELQRLKNEAAALRETAALMVLADEGYGAEFDALQRRIKALDLVIDKQGTLNEKNAMVAAATESQKAWERTAENIEKALTDALVQGFGNGKSIVKSIGDWIVNYFKSTIAAGIAKALTGAIMGGLGSIANAVGLGGGSGAAGGGGAGGLGDIGSILSSVLGGGSAFSTGALGALTGELGLGTGIELITSGASLAGGLGVIAPYAAAAAGLYALITGIGTGRQRSPAGQNLSYVDSSGASVGGVPYPTPNLQNGNAYDQVLQGVTGTINELVKKLGGTAAQMTYGLFTSVSPDGLGGQVVANAFDASGNSVYGYNVNGSNESVQARLESTLPGLIAAGLASADFGEEINKIFDGLNLSTVTAEQLAAAIAQAEEIKSANQQDVDQATIDTADATQENTIILRDNSEILDRIAAVLDRIEQISGAGLAETAAATREGAGAVVGAVLALADRPISVTLTPQEVNGGALA